MKTEQKRCIEDIQEEDSLLEKSESDVTPFALGKAISQAKIKPAGKELQSQVVTRSQKKKKRKGGASAANNKRTRIE